jgi:hypothetical protein
MSELKLRPPKSTARNRCATGRKTDPGTQALRLRSGQAGVPVPRVRALDYREPEEVLSTTTWPDFITQRTFLMATSMLESGSPSTATRSAK